MLTTNHPYEWQKSQWAWAHAALQQNKLPSVTLLLGIKGLGKKHFATLLAKALMCEQLTAEGLACEHCAACHLMNAETHPDYYPIAKNEEERVIRLEAIRELKTALSTTSFKGKGSVAFIEGAENLHLAAANALLKILEDPPPHVYFILSAPALDVLPATIVSRCHIVRFMPVLSTSLSASTPKKKRVTLSQGDFISWKMSGGAPLLAEQYENKNDQQWLQRFIESLLEVLEQKKSLVKWAATWSKENTSMLFSALLFYFSDQIKIAQGLDPATLHWTPYAERFKKIIPKNIFSLYESWDLLIEAKKNEKTALNIQYLLGCVLKDFMIK